METNSEGHMLVFKLVYTKYLHITRGCLPLSLKFKLIFASNVQIIYLSYFPPRDISPLISIFVI